MKTTNERHIPLQRVRSILKAQTSNDDFEWVTDSRVNELNYALEMVTPDFKIIHPLFIGKYSRIMHHHKDTPPNVVGFDIETNHLTGHPMLFGFHYDEDYFHIHKPTLENFYSVIHNLIDNSPGTNLVTWGNLDLQEVIRLFEPNSTEQVFLSRGIAGNFDRNRKVWIADPPIKRVMETDSGDVIEFFIDHYISNRSIRLGIRNTFGAKSLWIFNISQFYPARIGTTAKSLGLDWRDFSEDTHLIDWDRFSNDLDYRFECLESNKQDARIVKDLAYNLGSVFHKVFNAYPSLLVSAGSLADAAVSKLLSDDDYASNSWRWICSNNFNFRKNWNVVRKAETLLSEAFSAGYVDQFAMGYFSDVWTADISSAYPDKIRHLPDLRYAELFDGSGNPQWKINELRNKGYYIFTAVIRGHVNIPESLKYHPITIRTAKRQNIRPVGDFDAAYYLEERQFCSRYGAKFSNEEYVIFAFRKEQLAPIAGVSTKLRDLRNSYLMQRDLASSEGERTVLDGMQFMIKVVDNSLYGKTVMTTPIVEAIDDKPEITGFKGGDRYNMLYGGVITSRTRIQLAHVCMEIERAGGKPILAMTDSVSWVGKSSDIPKRFCRIDKTAGYFEMPELVHDFYLLKTGQYEYRKGNKWEHKMRGLNLPYDRRSDSESFYRKTLKEFCSNLDIHTHPKDIEIPLPTRKLVTIGAYDIDRLGLVEDSISNLKPFVMSGKQTQRYVFNWPKVLDSNVTLKNPIIVNGESPLAFLRHLYEEGAEHLTRYERKQLFYWECVLLITKTGDKDRLPLIKLPKRLTEFSYGELEDYFGITRKELGL